MKYDLPVYIRGTNIVALWEQDGLTDRWDWLYSISLEKELTGKIWKDKEVEHMVRVRWSE